MEGEQRDTFIDLRYQLVQVESVAIVVVDQQRSCGVLPSLPHCHHARQGSCPQMKRRRLLRRKSMPSFPVFFLRGIPPRDPSPCIDSGTPPNEAGVSGLPGMPGASRSWSFVLRIECTSVITAGVATGEDSVRASQGLTWTGPGTSQLSADQLCGLAG